MKWTAYADLIRMHNPVPRAWIEAAWASIDPSTQEDGREPLREAIRRSDPRDVWMACRALDASFAEFHEQYAGLVRLGLDQSDSRFRGIAATHQILNNILMTFVEMGYDPR